VKLHVIEALWILKIYKGTRSVGRLKKNPSIITKSTSSSSAQDILSIVTLFLLFLYSSLDKLWLATLRDQILGLLNL